MSDDAGGYVWANVRDELAARWTDTPSAHHEQRLLDVFEHHPELVIEAADLVGARFERGLIHSPWAILAKHAEEAAAAAERAARAVPATKAADDAAEKRAAVKRAEQWLRGAGLHYDREAEVDDELFGDFGKLRAWRHDAELRDRLLALWASVRPAGERVEAEAEERAARFRESRERATVPARPDHGLAPNPPDSADSAAEPWPATPVPF